MTNEVKKEIALAAVKLAEYVHNNKFEAIMISGGSNQISRSLLTLAWRNRFKGETMPKIHVFGRNANNLLYKTDDIGGNDLLSEVEEINKKLPELQKLKDIKVCYVDDFAITGGKFVILNKRFKELGLNDVKFAFFGATPISELSSDTFAGTLDLEANRELQALSLQIQGQPSLRDILKEIEDTAQHRRLQALQSLKEIGQQIRLK